MSEHGIFKYYERKINSFSIAIIVISSLCAALLVYNLLQEIDAFGRYKDDIDGRYKSMLNHFIPTVDQMYAKLYGILYNIIHNETNSTKLSNLTSSLIKQYIKNTTSWHGVPATREQPKRTIMDIPLNEFKKIPNYNGFLRYTMVVTPFNQTSPQTSCEMYILEPALTQEHLNRTSFKDHPWCSELHEQQTRPVATEPYFSDSQRQKVSTIAFPCCTIYSNNPVVTSYVGGTLGIFNITNQLLFNEYDLDQAQNKFMIFFKGHGTNNLFEPMERTKRNNSLTQTGDLLLRNSLDKLIDDNANKDHLLPVDLGKDGKYVIYWTNFPTIPDNDARGYKWYGIMMSKDAAINYDYYNNGFYTLIILIVLTLACAVCAFYIFWNYRKMKNDEDILEKAQQR